MTVGSLKGRLVLVVDPDLGFSDALSALLDGDRVVGTRTMAEAAAVAEGGRVDLALVGPSYGTEEGAASAAALRAADPTLLTVLVADVPTNRVLRAAMRAGLTDVVDAPVTRRKLSELLERADALDAARSVPVTLQASRVRGHSAVVLEPDDEPSGAAPGDLPGVQGSARGGPSAATAHPDPATVSTGPSSTDVVFAAVFGEAAPAEAPGNHRAAPSQDVPAPPQLPTADRSFPGPAPAESSPATEPVAAHQAATPSAGTPPDAGPETAPEPQPSPPRSEPIPEPPAPQPWADAVPEPPAMAPPVPTAPPPPAMPPPMQPPPQPLGMPSFAGLRDDPSPVPLRERRPGGGRVITVMAGKGGSGKTITATNLAATLTERLGEDKVVIVDADLQFGDVALLLQVDPTRTIVDAATILEDLSEARLDSILLRHESGLRVLPAPLVPSAAGRVPPKATVRIVEMLKGMYPFVVVDTAPIFDDALMTMLEHSDDVLMVVDMDLPSVKNAKIALDTLRALSFDMDRVRVLVNRANSKARLDLAELERALGKEVDASIPSDRLIPQSVNEGVPAVAFSPRSRVAKAFHALAELFLPAAPR